tara:strand:- start:347 stop:586 length:240 start_codon:yes stop_codon:yes gene_type:complete
MLKTASIVVNGDQSTSVRVFINNEIFLDQTLKFNKNKLTFHYASDLESDDCMVQNTGKGTFTCNNRFLLKSKQSTTFKL